MRMKLRKIKLRGILATVAIALAASSIATVAAAQTANQPSEPTRPLNDEFLRAFYANDGNFFQNRRLGRQIDFVLGVGTNFLNSFTDNEITGDGRAVNRLYNEAMREQTLSDGIIRTPDQENPFDTSLLLLPASSATLSTTSDIPPVPVVPFSPPPPLPEAAPQAAPSAPVPALW